MTRTNAGRIMRWTFAVIATLAAFGLLSWAFKEIPHWSTDVSMAIAGVVVSLLWTGLAAWAQPSDRNKPRIDPVAHDDAARHPTAPSKVSNLSRESPQFSGRADILDRLRQRMAEGHPVVLQGMGGVGKTQLALHYANHNADDYDVRWWVRAEKVQLIGEQLADLAGRLGLATVEQLFNDLHNRDRWLVIFDNASTATELKQRIPAGPGHVLITSQYRDWAGVAVGLEVEVLGREDSVRLLTSHAPALSRDEANQLAETLGDLPIGLTQCAAWMTRTGMPAGHLLDLLREGAADAVLSEGTPADYPEPFAVVVRMALRRLTDAARDEEKAAGQFAVVCSMLGPDHPIPLRLFDNPNAAGALAPPLAHTVTDRLALSKCVGLVRDIGLINVSTVSASGPDAGWPGVTMHRLTQLIIRDRLDRPNRQTTHDAVQGLLVAARPGDVNDPKQWPLWSQLMPHLLATDPAGSVDRDLRRLACDAVRYLVARGDADGARPLADSFYQRWLSQDGPDDPTVLYAAHARAEIMWIDGQYEQLRQLEQDALSRSRRVLGDDHPDTLVAEHNLASGLFGLGELEQAQQMFDDTLQRRRSVLGEHDPDTLLAADNLVSCLSMLGRHEEAHRLRQETWEHRRQVLGDDHPHTLLSANNLAVSLFNLGRVEEARQLQADTLARQRRVLGVDHPDTLWSAAKLAKSLYELHESVEARQVLSETLESQRRVLGLDHPDTRASQDLYQTFAPASVGGHRDAEA